MSTTADQLPELAEGFFASTVEMARGRLREHGEVAVWMVLHNTTKGDLYIVAPRELGESTAAFARIRDEMAVQARDLKLRHRCDLMIVCSEVWTAAVPPSRAVTEALRGEGLTDPLFDRARREGIMFHIETPDRQVTRLAGIVRDADGTPTMGMLAPALDFFYPEGPPPGFRPPPHYTEPRFAGIVYRGRKP